MNNELWISALVLVVVYLLEGALPFFPGRQQRLRHAAPHLGLALINGGVNLVFGVLAVPILAWAYGRTGILPVLNTPSWSKLLIAFVLFDLWMYTWHRLNHTYPFFWRFHKCHHSDIQMDASTALRFHPGEIALSNCFNILVAVVLGFNVLEFTLYKALMLPIVVFHHSNIAFPEKFDRIMRLVIVSPHMHRVHHSQLRQETDSNYGSVFTFWDRLLGSFRLHSDPARIVLGLEKYREPRWQNLKGILLTPLK